MLNSILNGDWSNSVPGRQFPRGAALGHLPKLQSTECCPMVNPSVPWFDNLEILDLHKFGQFYTNKNVVNAKV